MPFSTTPPFDTTPELRLSQRNDGAGINGHARFTQTSTPNHSTSEQVQISPRLVQNREVYL